ncbi:serine/threonine kinase [Synechococcus elongatus PCC 6301]|uniref:non-specific serine/threonine protein kinase n=2 Tax=Synechococcus elongatus TaxID=32046 RepID=A0A0H3JZZ4_SYNP6|nr:serine/threonine kinase [Synechococcus elongatus PCC 6301]
MTSNPSSSPFPARMATELQLGVVLSDRYQVVRELGQGGFGRTYLAKDLNRFKEECVLKEFAPQVEGEESLQKAQDLFHREAGVLYQIEHPQIPRFRELLRVTHGGQGRLLLVQDYVAGQTYQQILEMRRAQGQTFSPAEALSLLQNLLPVLNYLHQAGVVHRDISPDNLICRDRDGLPVLIDFGGVKAAAAEAVSQFAQRRQRPLTATRLGKAGYAPGEQMQQGIAYPHGDLYALAVTLLVLMTGEDPQDLQDPLTLEWLWREHLSLDPTFAAVLDRMLALRPRDRFASAAEVQAALTGVALTPEPIQPIHPPSPTPSQLDTVVVAPRQVIAPPAVEPAPTQILTPPSASIEPGSSAAVEEAATTQRFIWAVLAIVFAVFAAGTGWWAARTWLGWQTDSQTPTTPTLPLPDPTPDPTNFSQQRAELANQLQAMQVDPAFFELLVNESFFQAVPERRGQPPSDRPEDRELQQRWLSLAKNWIVRLNSLPVAERSRLGRYSISELSGWLGIAQQQSVSEAAFRAVVDAQYSYLSDDSAAPLRGSPREQVWLAIAAAQAAILQAGEGVTLLTWNEDGTAQVGGNLAPGQGRIFLLPMQAGEVLQLNFSGGAGSAYSVFAPANASGEAIISGDNAPQLQRTLMAGGVYQIVVTSAAGGTVSFSVNAQRAIAEPEPAPQPQPNPTPVPPSAGTPTKPEVTLPAEPSAPLPDPEAPAVPEAPQQP